MKQAITGFLALALCGGLSAAASAEQERTTSEHARHYVPVVEVIALDEEQAARLRDERERQKQERARLREEHQRTIDSILGS